MKKPAILPYSIHILNSQQLQQYKGKKEMNKKGEWRKKRRTEEKEKERKIEGERGTKIKTKQSEI
jgi:hypothetical protein